MAARSHMQALSGDSPPVRLAGRLSLVPLAALALVAAALALGASPAAAACANEEARLQSRENPATDRPYSTLLPECRAYELVSPVESQSGEVAGIQEDVFGTQLAAAPGREGAAPAVLFGSAPGLVPASGTPRQSGITPYLAHRVGSAVQGECPQHSYPCWITTAAAAPATLVQGGALGEGLEEPIGDFSEALSQEAVCNTPPGYSAEVAGKRLHTALACVLREQGPGGLATGPWVGGEAADGLYPALAPQVDTVAWPVMGSSANLSHVILQAPAGTAFLKDAKEASQQGALYEAEALGGAGSILRLVNVNDSGELLGSEGAVTLGGGPERLYQAVSANGAAVFFTAAGTIYARLDHAETVALSQPQPAECSEAECANSYPADYVGAAADGSKVFFESEQKLVNGTGVHGGEAHLYEYDFGSPEGRHIHELAGGKLKGVMAISPDGSHVYLVTERMLDGEGRQETQSRPVAQENGNGQQALEAWFNATQGSGSEESPQYNLYAFSTTAEEARFVSPLSPDAPAAEPIVESVRPPGGPTAGGTAVTITGWNLSHVETVDFGEVAVTGAGIESKSATRLVVRSPARPQGGTVAVSVSSKGAPSVPPDPEAAHYTYSQESTPQPEAEGTGANTFRERAQVTPNGRYLVFDTWARPKVAEAERQEASAQQVYRYQAEDESGRVTGTLVRVSVGHERYANNGNGYGKEEHRTTLPAHIAPPVRPRFAAYADAANWDRAISDDGAYILFESPEALQREAYNGGAQRECNSPNEEEVVRYEHNGEAAFGEGSGCNVYLWHACAAEPAQTCPDGNAGEVSLISPGAPGEEGMHVYPTMSASGSDLYFVTRTSLLRADGNDLTDLYDARLAGGMQPASRAECAGEACREAASAQRESFPFVFSGAFVGPGNVLSSGVGTTPSAPLTVKVIGHRMLRGALALTVRSSARGVVTVTGKGIRTRRATVGAGTHRLRVRLGPLGIATGHRHGKLRLRVKLAASKHSKTITVAVRL